MQYQFVRKKQMVHPAVPNSDTLVDASVTVYPIYTDQGSSKFWKRSTWAIVQEFESQHLAQCDFLGICYVLPNQQVFRKYITFSLLAKYVFRPGEMAS